MVMIIMIQKVITGITAIMIIIEILIITIVAKFIIKSYSIHILFQN